MPDSDSLQREDIIPSPNAGAKVPVGPHCRPCRGQRDSLYLPVQSTRPIYNEGGNTM